MPRAPPGGRYRSRPQPAHLPRFPGPRGLRHSTFCGCPGGRSRS